MQQKPSDPRTRGSDTGWDSASTPSTYKRASPAAAVDAEEEEPPPTATPGLYSTATHVHRLSWIGAAKGADARAPFSPVASRTRYRPWKYASTPCFPPCSVETKLNKRGMCSCASPAAAAAAAAAAAGDCRWPARPPAAVAAAAAISAAAAAAVSDPRSDSRYTHVTNANPRSLNGQPELEFEPEPEPKPEWELERAPLAPNTPLPSPSSAKNDAGPPLLGERNAASSARTNAPRAVPRASAAMRNHARRFPTESVCPAISTTHASATRRASSSR